MNNFNVLHVSTQPSFMSLIWSGGVSLSRLILYINPFSAVLSPPPQGSLQEVIGWGLLGWKLYTNVNGPNECKALSSLGVTQIVCSEKGFLILASSGAVYTQNYKCTTLVQSLSTHGWDTLGHSQPFYFIKKYIIIPPEAS